MTWTVILDPAALAGTAPANRTQLDLNNGAIMVDQKGLDWGDSQIQTYLADRRVGSIKIDFRMPNRKITIPLFLMDDPSGVGLTEEQARAQLQQKVGLIQMSGGWLMRQRAGGPPTYADIIDAILTLPDVWGETGSIEANVNLILECSPDFYSDEIALDLATISGGNLTGPLKQAGLNATILGDHLGRASIIVTDTSGSDQSSLIWGFRATYYDPAATAALSYDATNLNIISPAASASVPGALGGTAVQLTGVSTSWVPIVSTDVGGTAPMTHIGSYRIRARVQTTSSTKVWLRLVWGVGAAVGITANDLVLIPGINNWYIVDLGEIRVDYPPIGTLRWEGQIQGQGQTGSETAIVDQIYLQPLDDAAGYATASGSVSSLASPVATDFFTGASGNLAGSGATLGGTWSEPAVGAGDFQVNNSLHAVTRSVIDAAAHYAYLGTNQTSMSVVSDIGMSDFQAGSYAGVIARYVDTVHWFGAAVYCQVTHGTTLVYMMKANGGAPTVLSTVVVASLPVLPTTFNLNLVISAAGVARAYLNGSAVGTVTDTDLATGGALASGKGGIWEQAAPNAITRQYDNFMVYPTSPSDAVCFGHASASLRYDGLFRADTTNTYFGPIANVVGDLPRIPPSGIENRPVELFLLLSRGDMQAQADTTLGSFTAQLRYRPVYIHRS